MNNMDLVLKLVVGHIIGDFLFQLPSVAQRKTTEWKFMVIHIAGIFIALAICTMDYWSPRFFLCIGLISLCHLIDYLKRSWPESLSLFFVDQGIHLSTLFLIPGYLGLINLGDFFQIINRYYHNTTMWVYIAGYTFGIFAGRIIIQELCKKVFCDLDASNSPVSAYIGMAERTIIITLALLAQYTAISIIFAIKGTARKLFAETNEKNGEYYFLGTAMSFIIALISALGIEFIIKCIGR